MIVTSVESHLAVRWALPNLRDDRLHAGEVSTGWQSRQVHARFLVRELQAMAGDLDVTMHPAIRSWIASVVPAHGLAETLTEGLFEEPLTRVSLYAQVPDISAFVTEGDDGTADTGTGTGTGTKVLSYAWLSRVNDLVLDLSSHALQAVLDDAIDHAEESAQPVYYRRAGPLCMADLAGAGIAVLRDESGEEFSVPLLSRPPLGSRGAPPAHDHHAGDLHGAGFHLGSTRRLFEWNQRHRLRLIRGEWADSVVGLEAAIEQLLWSISESVMVEHGWTRVDIEDSNRVPNLFALLTFLQHHLHGNAGEWRRIRQEVVEPVWKLRNAVIHRADAIDEVAARAHNSSLGDLLSFLKPKIESRRRQHPLTAYIWSPECLSAAEQAIVQRVTMHPDLVDTRDINDLAPWAFAGEVDESLKHCPSIDRIRMLEQARTD